jgi:hypothetical protein
MARRTSFKAAKPKSHANTSFHFGALAKPRKARKGSGNGGNSGSRR